MSSWTLHWSIQATATSRTLWVIFKAVPSAPILSTKLLLSTSFLRTIKIVIIRRGTIKRVSPPCAKKVIISRLSPLLPVVTKGRTVKNLPPVRIGRNNTGHLTTNLSWPTTFNPSLSENNPKCSMMTFFIRTDSLIVSLSTFSTNSGCATVLPGSHYCSIC